MALETDLAAAAVAGALSDAAGRRDSGELPGGFERDLEARFDAIARDPAALQREVDAGALLVPQAYRFGLQQGRQVAGPDPSADRTDRAHRLALALPRRGVAAARRVAGPSLRSLQRRGIDQVGRAGEAIATASQVGADRVRRLATSGGRSRRLERLSPGGRALPAGLRSRGLSGSAAVAAATEDVGTAAAEVASWTLERLGSGPGRVLHVECGDGTLVRRLAVSGFEAAGADPGALPSRTIARAGALERLGREPRASLVGLVVSGISDEVTPGAARAIAHLARSRLRHAGVVVICSTWPDDGADDPVAADLSPRRALHPVTWCHLLAREGFGDLAVRESEAGGPPLYAVAGRRR